MPSSLSTIVAKDGTPATIAGGILAVDKSGAGTGPFFAAQTLVDTQGVNTATIKAASTAPTTTDTAIVVGSADGNIVTMGALADAAVAAGATGSLSAKLRAISRDLVANIVLAAGSALIGIVKVGDGTNSAAIKAASTPPVAGDPALVVAISPNSVNANGSALPANCAPTTNAPTSFRVAVTPTLANTTAYTAGNVVGGILTFANALLATPTASPTKWSAILESISVKFKAAVVTGEIDVAIFTASPSGGTYTDHVAPTANAADQAKLVGIYALPTPQSTLGTMTCYNLDGIGAVIDGASTSLFAVVTVKGTPTPASTTDVIVELGVLQG